MVGENNRRTKGRTMPGLVPWEDRYLLFAPDEGAGGDGGADDSDGAGDGDAGETVTVPKAEWDAAQRERAEARREAKKAKAAAERAAATQAGSDDDLKKAAEDAQKRAEQAEARLTEHERRSRVTQAASRLGFRDPTDAFRFLDEDDLDDDASVDRALKQVKREKPYLAAPKPRSGGDIDGGNDGEPNNFDSLIRQGSGRA